MCYQVCVSAAGAAVVSTRYARSSWRCQLKLSLHCTSMTAVVQNICIGRTGFLPFTTGTTGAWERGRSTLSLVQYIPSLLFSGKSQAGFLVGIVLMRGAIVQNAEQDTQSNQKQGNKKETGTLICAWILLGVLIWEALILGWLSLWTPSHATHGVWAMIWHTSYATNMVLMGSRIPGITTV